MRQYGRDSEMYMEEVLLCGTTSRSEYDTLLKY